MAEVAGKVGAIYASSGSGTNVSAGSSDWAASTAYSEGDFVEPTTANGFIYRCTTAGTSGSTEPTWPTTEGDTVSDGTVVWTCHDNTIALNASGVGSTANANVWINALYEDNGGEKGAEISPSKYTWTVKGQITCADYANQTVHVDYTYYTVSQVGGFFNWGLSHVVDVLETTDFADSGNRTYIAALKGWTGSAERHWLSDEAVDSWLGTKIIVKFYVDVSNSLRYEGWAYVTGISVDTPVDALVNEPIEFQGTKILSLETT